MKAKQVKRVLPEQIVNQVDTWGLGVQKEIEKKQKGLHCLSGWDGAYRPLVVVLKNI